MKDIKDDTRWKDVSMFLNWKNQYCQNDHTTQSNAHIQCNPTKLPVSFFIELEQKKVLKSVWSHKRPWAATVTLRKMELEGSGHPASYSHQNSVVPVREQKNRSMKQERKPRNNPCTYSQLTYNGDKIFPGCSVVKNLSANSGEEGSIPGLRRFPGEGIGYPLQYSWASLMAQTVKNLPAMQETWVWSLGQEDPWRRAWQPIPIFLPGKSPMDREAWWATDGAKEPMGLQGLQNLWGCKESDMTEWLSTALRSLLGLEKRTTVSKAPCWIL